MQVLNYNIFMVESDYLQDSAKYFDVRDFSNLMHCRWFLWKILGSRARRRLFLLLHLRMRLLKYVGRSSAKTVNSRDTLWELVRTFSLTKQSGKGVKLVLFWLDDVLNYYMISTNATFVQSKSVLSQYSSESLSSSGINALYRLLARSSSSPPSLSGSIYPSPPTRLSATGKNISACVAANTTRASQILK